MTETRAGATTRIVSEVNKTSILETLQRTGPMTLHDVREVTGLSPATVTRIVDRLRADRLIVDAGLARSSGGRPPRLIAYNSRRHSVIAVDIGARTTTGGVFDLQGNQLCAHDVATTPEGGAPAGAGAVFEQVLGLIKTLRAEAAELDSPAQMVGVGVPGTVRADTGMVQFAPSVQWWDLPLQSLLSERLEVPVVVENDVNLVALAEHRFGAAQGARNAVTFAIGTGVGAGIIVNEQLYRGTHGGSGEVGYMLMTPASMEQPWPGFGDLESRISGRVLVERARAAIGATEAELTHPRDVLTLVRQQDARIMTIFDEMVEYVAMALANICSVLNPEVVVLAGGAGQDIAELAIPRIHSRLQGRIPLVPHIVPGSVEDAELIGASQIAIESGTQYRYVTGHSG